MAFDFRPYTVYDLAFFATCGSITDPKIREVGDLKEIRRVIRDYVATKPREFREEFEREFNAGLEAKTSCGRVGGND